MKARANDIECPKCGEAMRLQIVSLWDLSKAVTTCYRCETVTEEHPYGGSNGIASYTLKEYMGPKEYRKYKRELKKRGLKYYDYKGD